MKYDNIKYIELLFFDEVNNLSEKENTRIKKIGSKYS